MVNKQNNYYNNSNNRAAGAAGGAKQKRFHRSASTHSGAGERETLNINAVEHQFNCKKPIMPHITQTYI